MSTIILQSCYLGPVSYYSALLNAEKALLEVNDHYGKQTYRNRCRIATANKVMDLTIPVERTHEKTAMKDIAISYDEDWQKTHWNAIESAYRTSAYFDYYADELQVFYQNKERYLLDLNMKLHELVVKWMQLEDRIQLTSTTEYHTPGESEIDLRTAFNPKSAANKTKPYYQVFSQRHGFIADLSVLDLVLNEGPEAYKYL
ncbi:MAG: WbqC family protein [Paludibacteraceae bacterium]|nr:WbqC family protein [Paludibacteraceae bacterium]